MYFLILDIYRNLYYLSLIKLTLETPRDLYPLLEVKENNLFIPINFHELISLKFKILFFRETKYIYKIGWSVLSVNHQPTHFYMDQLKLSTWVH